VQHFWNSGQQRNKAVRVPPVNHVSVCLFTLDAVPCITEQHAIPIFVRHVLYTADSARAWYLVGEIAPTTLRAPLIYGLKMRQGMPL
jgi:hypothetical protein